MVKSYMSVIINKIQSSFKHLAVNLTITYSFWNGLPGSWDQNEILFRLTKSVRSLRQQSSPSSALLTLGLFPSCGGSLVHRRILSSNPGLWPLHNLPIPIGDNHKCLQKLLNAFWGAKSLLVQNNWTRTAVRNWHPKNIPQKEFEKV